MRRLEAKDFNELSCSGRLAPLKPGVGLSEGVQIFSNLSFRPEPERQRRRSGGTGCPQPAPQPLRHLSEPPVILKERALCAIEGPLHAIRSSQPPQGVLSSPTQGPPLQQRKASPPCHSEAFTTLSFRPEPERQRRRSGEPALSLPKGTCCCDSSWSLQSVRSTMNFLARPASVLLRWVLNRTFCFGVLHG